MKEEERFAVSSYREAIPLQGTPSLSPLIQTVFQRLHLKTSHQRLECILNTKFATPSVCPTHSILPVLSRLCVTCDMYLPRRGVCGLLWGPALRVVRRTAEEDLQRQKTLQALDQDSLAFGCLGVSRTPKFRSAAETVGSKFNDGAPGVRYLHSRLACCFKTACDNSMADGIVDRKFSQSGFLLIQ